MQVLRCAAQLPNSIMQVGHILPGPRASITAANLLNSYVMEIAGVEPKLSYKFWHKSLSTNGEHILFSILQSCFSAEITWARIASEIGAHSAEEHFCITRRDKAVLRTSSEFLPKINSIFYSSPEIIRPCPHPNPHRGGQRREEDAVQKWMGPPRWPFAVKFQVKSHLFLRAASNTRCWSCPHPSQPAGQSS